MNNLPQESFLQKYLVSSNEAVEFKLVRKREDIADEKISFHPEMSHQIYGDSEQIFGYSGLKVQLYYTACNLNTYLSTTYQDKIDASKCEGVKADDVIKPIAEQMPPGFLTNLDDFVSSLEKDGKFKPFGEMKHRFTKTLGDEDKVFEIYNHDITPKGFQDYHEKLQTFLLWFVDASSYICPDDRWKFFMVYEKYLINGNPQYAIAGYATVYEYYAYPNHIRPRISQMLILPPFQRSGLGAELLQIIYNHYTKDSNTLDITVEDPSESFQNLRDFVDSKNCLKLNIFPKSSLRKGFSNEMLKQAQKELKLSKIQARRIYEILRLKATDRANPEDYKTYRLSIKNRLNVHYKREDNYIKKVKKCISQDELIASGIITSTKQRHENLEVQYKELEEEYDHIIDKLESDPSLI